MIRAHKIRLNPTKEDEAYLNKAAGTKRFTYNWALDQWKWAKEQAIPEYGMMKAKKDFNAIKRDEYPWVMDVAKDVAEGAFSDAAKALKNYFESKTGKRKGPKVGFPRYKSRRRSRQSFRLNNDKMKVDGHWLYIPKLKSGWINMAEELRFDGKIMGAVVSKTADWWFVSITVKMDDPPPLNHPVKSVGIDVGLKTLATLSDGTQFENQELLKQELRTLKRLNRKLSRQVKGSKRWGKTKRKIARVHYRIACKRVDYLHKMTTWIAKRYKLIGAENLHVLGMVKNRRLARSLSDASFGEILRQLEYKAKWFGGKVQRVGRFFASSKACHCCGYVHQTLTLSERTWTCDGCNTTHDRDWNASKNIEQEALRLAR